MPIISVSTQAPEPEQASRLADAAFKALQEQLESVASTDNVPTDRRLVVRQLGPATAELETRGPAKAMAAIAAIVVFGMGCAAILLFVALVGGWRAANEFERNPPQPVAVDGYIKVNGYVNGNGNGHHPPQPAVVPTPACRPSCSARSCTADDTPDQAAPKRNWASR